MRKMETARGPPNDRGRLVTSIKMGPRFFKLCSLAASEADVDEAGYSPLTMLILVAKGCYREMVPPAPNPTTPLLTVNIQNMPFTVTPFEAVDIMLPRTMRAVVAIMANFRPR